jgi:hypothetical protein
MLTVTQIEQFIETLYPRQNATKLAQENSQKQRKEPTTDPGEAVVLFGVAVACMIFMSLMMVSLSATLQIACSQANKWC